MPRLLPLIAAAAAVLGFAPAADAKPATCHSGKTLSNRGGVRVFLVGGNEDRWYACGPRSVRPTLLTSAPGGYGDLRVLGRSGDKVVVEGVFANEGGGGITSVGWFDARTSKAASADLAGESDNEVRDFVVLSDGSMLVVVAPSQEQTRIAYLPWTKRGLRGEFALATAPAGYVKGSLRLVTPNVFWKERTGATRSVPLTGERVTCTTGTTLLDSDGTRVFEVLPNRKTEGGFQADVLAACTPGATAPRELAVSNVPGHWAIGAVKRAGARVAFQAGAAVGLIDGATARVVSPQDLEGVEDVAIGAAGPPVFAGRPYPSGPEIIARLTTGNRWEELATQGGEIAPGSLAVGDDGRVTWRTRKGVAQSTPLAGETAVDCTTGTTLIANDGLRVFEQLLAGAPGAGLYACAPALIQLRTGPRNAHWDVFVLARENGRVALLTAGVVGDFGEDVVSFGAGPDSLRAGAANVDLAIKDAAIAPDGRVALARNDGRTWTVSVVAPLKERVIARPSDGVQIGSLAFDGTRVVWRSRAGTEHGAASP